MKAYLKEATSTANGHISSTRIVTLLASLTLSLCTLILTIGAFWRIELTQPLTVFGGVLGGMAGTGYAMNRWATKGTEP